ncbi:hypothetical protein MKW92_027797 [Papaver armeniacum]|nr:hypothetical protein MKW92_027797 [Papaver armeniacum]
MEEPRPLKRALIDVQLEPTSSRALLRKYMYGSSKYTRMMHATKDILRQEGLLGSSKAKDYIHFSPCLSYLSRALAGSAANPNVYTTMTSAFVDIVRSRGFRGLYAGLPPTLVEIIPYVVPKSFLMLAYEVVCHYLDVVKKRFQIIGLPRDPLYGAWVEHHAYNGISDALRCILITEGWAGLYKGVPSVIKASLARAVTFVTYEYTSQWLESHLTWNIV